MAISCIDCPPGNVITDHAYKVQRRVKNYEPVNPLDPDAPRRYFSVDTIEGVFDYYCVKHYQERVDAETL